VGEKRCLRLHLLPDPLNRLPVAWISEPPGK
jgi:hypothetical protein